MTIAELDDTGRHPRVGSDTASFSGALIGPTTSPVTDLRTHHATFGDLPRLAPDDVTRLAADAGLTGHGGAGFPLWRKLEAVAAARGRAIVVANGAEGEPASAKDRWLLAHRPHLVLDGLQLVARAVNAHEAFVYANPRAPLAHLGAALAQRNRARIDRLPATLVAAHDAFVAGEESAVASYLSGGLPIPRAKPPRVVEKGVRDRPTLVSNVETLALLALIARRGPAWFRSMGTAEQPGTMLFTVSGAVRHPGVVEAAHGTPLAEIVDLAGGATARLRAVLLGGYHGTWLTAHEAAGATMSRAQLATFGASTGAGVVVAVGEETCGLVEMARVMNYLAHESAGQCGPCLNGLPRIASQVRSLAYQGRDQRVVAELERVAGLVVGRGACHHPDGSVRFLRSGMRVFGAEIALHAQGRCSRTSDAAVLPTHTA
jgi:NADH:ubiquinone oxidoreductase subunit F (NADH-binding)